MFPNKLFNSKAKETPNCLNLFLALSSLIWTLEKKPFIIFPLSITIIVVPLITLLYCVLHCLFYNKSFNMQILFPLLLWATFKTSSFKWPLVLSIRSKIIKNLGRKNEFTAQLNLLANSRKITIHCTFRHNPCGIKLYYFIRCS